MVKMGTVYFITHPEVNIDPSVPVTEWSLSRVGLQRMRGIVKLKWFNSIGSIYSSSERKAIEGAQIMSEHLGIPVAQVKELGENDRSSTGYLPSAEFESVADQFFAAATHSVRGWETAVDAQNRIVGAVKNIVQSQTEDSAVGIVSHGAVGTLLLCHLNQWNISREYDQPGNGGGNYFSFSKSTFKVNHGWVAIDTRSACRGLPG